jgi:hypothetical protein
MDQYSISIPHFKDIDLCESPNRCSLHLPLDRQVMTFREDFADLSEEIRETAIGSLNAFIFVTIGTAREKSTWLC